MKQVSNFAGQNRVARRLFALVFALSLVVLSLSAIAAAQQLTATLTGTVTDPSGAVVPGAAVLVHNNDTNTDVRTVVTSGTGSYNITNLPAGRYTVNVSNAGFQTFIARDVVLNVAEKHTLDVQLKAGQVSERVEVTAENTPIQTTTAEESGTVTGDQVRELALNNRNFEQLVLLQPGVANQLPDKVGFGLQNNTSISINGARTGANNWMVDGGDINDSGSNGTLLNTPGIDAIQEFTLERSNYDAAFGRSGGGQVVVATKSGTNQFHGSAYEFNRNNYYNANTFGDRQAIAFGGNPADNKTPIERYNDYGFTIGGPLFIPKLYHPAKNKTFFFWSEEWRKASLPATNTITVPTAAMLAGQFTTPIPVAPAGCVTSSGGIYTIAPSCFSTNATAYLNAFMAKYPAPAGSDLLITPYSQLNNFRQDIIRLDQNVGDKLRLYARYMEDVVPQNFPFSLWGGNNYPGVETTAVNAPGRNLVLNATANINPRVVNEVEFVDAWGAINANLSAIANSPAFTSTLTNNTAYADPYGRAPNVSIAGYTGLGNGVGPYFERNIDRNIFDNLSIQHGNHTIRTGFTAMWMQKTENASAGVASFNFLDDTTTGGNPAFANFLLGQADSYSQPNKDTIPHLRYINFEAYVQDDWKVTRKLTLNLGVRYSYFPSPTDSNNTLVNFDPNLFNPSLAPVINPDGTGAGGFDAATYANGLIFPKGAACSAAQAVSPQVSCSPFGSRINPSSNQNWGPRFGLAYDPFGDGKWAVRAGYGIFYDRTLNGIWEQNAFADPPLVQTTTINNATNDPLNLFDNPLGGTPAAAPNGPVALTSTGLPTFKVPSYQDYNISVQHEIVPNTVLEVGYVGTKGTHLLGDIDINQPTLANRVANPTLDVNAIRPFIGYGTINSRVPTYTSNYNSLQVSLNRHFSRGLSAGIAYTWSKLLTTNPYDRGLSAYDTYDLKSSYGPSVLNTPQMFVANYVYDFPFYKNNHGVAGMVLGGWELSGIVTIQSGQSQIITQSNDPWVLAGMPGGLGMTRPGDTVYIRPDQIGNPHGPKTVLQWFNTAAFADAVGHFGSSRPGAILGPGYQIWDTSLIKNFNFKEKASLQLRLETFNTFNHGSPSGIDTGVDDSSFGQVTGWHDPRTVQIGAKIKF
jgi:hypothetical protein